MGKIIDANKLDEHNIQKFQFGVIPSKESEEDQEILDEDKEASVESEQESREKFAELLQKTDDLSSENIKLQMRIETLEKELEDKISETREEYHKKGREEGIKETQESMQEDNEELKSRLIKSITLLDETLLLHKESIKKIEDNIQDIAISLAQKIVNKELEENSHKVALSLVASLIDEIDDSLNITLKVNPKDYLYIEEAYQERQKIDIETDEAVAQGGVILLSSEHNIDGNIPIRVQKAIDAL
jgi:flagellar assembly protein FliH